jgi:hypothetical protein
LPERYFIRGLLIEKRTYKVKPLVAMSQSSNPDAALSNQTETLLRGKRLLHRDQSEDKK